MSIRIGAIPTANDTAHTARERKTLTERRRRLRDLYELGDLDRHTYLARRQAIDADLDALALGPAPDLDEARRVLDDFGLFWQQERDPEKRRQLLHHVFDRVWIDEKRIVAVRPKPAFMGFFAPPETNNAAKKAAMCKPRERRDSNPRPPA